MISVDRFTAASLSERIYRVHPTPSVNLARLCRKLQGLSTRLNLLIALGEKLVEKTRFLRDQQFGYLFGAEVVTKLVRSLA